MNPVAFAVERKAQAQRREIRQDFSAFAPFFMQSVPLPILRDMFLVGRMDFAGFCPAGVAAGATPQIVPPAPPAPSGR